MEKAEPSRPDINRIPETTAGDDDTLVEVLDRVLDTGVVVVGDLNISVADVELICLRLQLVLSSAETARQAGLLDSAQHSCPEVQPA